MTLNSITSSAIDLAAHRVGSGSIVDEGESLAFETGEVDHDIESLGRGDEEITEFEG